MANKGIFMDFSTFYNDNSIYKLFIFRRTYSAIIKCSKANTRDLSTSNGYIGEFLYLDTILYLDNFVTTHKYFCSRFLESTSFNTCDKLD